MTRFVIENEQDRQMAINDLRRRAFPFTVTSKDGRPRSYKQNRLMRQWCNDLAEQGDMTAEEYRGYNKAYFGIPILLRDDEEFAERYERVVRPLDYETKLQLMQAPFDFPVTRLMYVHQEKEMLDAIWVYWTGKGFWLTDPDELTAQRQAEAS
jgi:hypothetical protein